MANLAGPGDLEAVVGALARETHFGQAFEATAILQAVRPAGRLAQNQPVQG